MKTIRASEVGEYVYCARAWWLRRALGLEPAGQARRDWGTTLHARHGRAVVASGALLALGAMLLVVAVVLILFSLR